MATLFSVLCLIGLPDEAAGADERTYWAFRQLEQKDPPVVENGEWAQTGIDRFVLARARAEGVDPNGPVGRRKLIRRAYFDLIGLAPTRQEVEAFIADESPDAYEKILTRLLASPHYGERWGRHWLDVARYADNKGYVGVGVNRLYPYSYTYRDYVVRSFNEDLPYNRFIIEQLAADKLDLGEDKRPLAAMGFLTLGRRFLNRTDDIIDDPVTYVIVANSSFEGYLDEFIEWKTKKGYHVIVGYTQEILSLIHI